jgi:hypothetical protein
MHDGTLKCAFLAFFCSTVAGVALGQIPSNLVNEYQRDVGARTSFARGEAARASDTLQATSKANPFDPVALNNLAVTQAAQGDYLNAITSLERAYRLAPSRADIASNLKNLQLWIGQNNTSVISGRAISPLIFPRAEDAPPELPALWGRMDVTDPAAQAVRPIGPVPPPPTAFASPNTSTPVSPTTAARTPERVSRPEIIVLTPSIAQKAKRR